MITGEISNKVDQLWNTWYVPAYGCRDRKGIIFAADKRGIGSDTGRRVRGRSLEVSY